MKNVVALALCITFGACHAPAVAPAPPRAAPSAPVRLHAAAPSFLEAWTAERKAVQAAARAKDYAAYRAHLGQLYVLSGSSGIRREMARAEALSGRRAEAIATLEAVAAMGVSADVAADPAFAALHDDPAFVRAEAALHANASPITHARLFASLPSEELLAEDIAYDSATHGFFVSSLRRRKVLAVDAVGHARDFAALGESDSGGLGGLVLGADVIWATTAWLPHVRGGPTPPTNAKPTGLVSFDRKTGAIRERVALPIVAGDADRTLSDLTMSPNGTLYVSDSERGDLYVLAPGSHALALLVPHDELISPQTPALSPDGARLYVPDYVRGIAAIDLATRSLTWLTRGENVALDGIDGLYAFGDSLVAVQNGVEPPRIVRFALDRSGSRVLRAEVLERSSPGLGEPTHGVITEGTFYFIANAGWDRYDDEGKPKPDPPRDAPAIWKLPL